MLYRRTFIKALASIPWVTMPMYLANAASGISLKDLAVKKNIRFGTAVGFEIFRNQKFQRHLLNQCNIITPENALKWRALVKANKLYDFGSADRLYKFAQKHDLQLRGHALIFEKSMQNWVRACHECDLEYVIESHIRTLIARYPEIISWDLFNEITSPDGADGWLTKDSIYKKLGINYVKHFTQLVHSIIPTSELVINEWIGPYNDRYSEKRRASVLRMLEYLKNNEVPVNSLGVQSHLNFHQKDYNQGDWLFFCKECKDLGFELKITELDLSQGKSGRVKYAKKEVAQNTQRYLEDTLSFANTKDIICWGLIESYAYSMGNPQWQYLNYGSAPFRSDYQPDILATAISSALQNAPVYQGMQ